MLARPSLHERELRAVTVEQGLGRDSPPLLSTGKLRLYPMSTEEPWNSSKRGGAVVQSFIHMDSMVTGGMVQWKIRWRDGYKVMRIDDLS